MSQSREMYLRTLLNTTLSTLLAITLGGCINASTTNPDQPSTMPETSTPTTPSTPSTTPKELPLTGFTAITAGRNHGCIIKNSDKTLWCWGEGTYGQLGTNNKTNSSAFTAVGSGLWQNVSGGYTHTCGVAVNEIPDPVDLTQRIQLHQLYCWGDNTAGAVGYGTTVLNYYEPMRLQDDDWSSVSAGNNHSCAIRLDKTLWCWGDNSNNQLGIPSVVTNNIRPEQVGSDKDWSAVSASDQFTCALKENQSLWCWGITTGSATPLPIAPTVMFGGSPTILSTWKSITTGQAHGCGIVSSNNLALNDTLWCWGDNSHGQIGNGTTVNQPPFQVTTSSITTWAAVATGHQHTCAIALSDKSLWCWGNNETGQLGINSTAHQSRPAKINHDKGWLMVTAGESHTCAVDKDEIVHCWGYNNRGQLANGANLDTKLPRNFDSSTNWQSIDSGYIHSCGLKGDSPPYTLWCSGFNHYGQLGIGSTSNQAALTQINANQNTAIINAWDSLAIGRGHTCAIAINGAEHLLFCWGANIRGQLGNNAILGNVPQHWWPNTNSQVVTGANDWSMVAAGVYNSCGIKGLNELWCWGDNSAGQIANGITSLPTDPPFSPTQISGSWLSVAVGGTPDSSDHICAIKSDGTLWCWGKNDKSQLGDGTTVDRNTIQQIGSASNWIAVKAGGLHTCGLQSDNTLWCWGDNSRGQTGVSAVGGIHPSTVTIPTQESTNSSWFDFDVGYNFTCAIRDNRTLWCWGDNLKSQLTSVIDTETKFTPTLVDSDPEWGWYQLALGTFHSCGIRENLNTLDRYTFCWGEHAPFQFGDGSAWKSTPQPLPLKN